MKHALGIASFLFCASAMGQGPSKQVSFEHSAFSVPLQEGERVQKGASDEGMVTVKSAPADQVLYWDRASKSLKERADHERGLMLRAAEETGENSKVTEYVRDEKPGKGSLSWTAQIGRTQFRATVVDCRSHHILLTTFGPRLQDVDARHAVSIRGIRCANAAPAR